MVEALAEEGPARTPAKASWSWLRSSSGATQSSGLSSRKLSFRASDGSIDIESGLRSLSENLGAGVKHIASTARLPGEALNRKIDVVGDFAVERAVGAAAGALGKKLSRRTWIYSLRTWICRR